MPRLLIGSGVSFKRSFLCAGVGFVWRNFLTAKLVPMWRGTVWRASGSRSCVYLMDEQLSYTAPSGQDCCIPSGPLENSWRGHYTSVHERTLQIKTGASGIDQWNLTGNTVRDGEGNFYIFSFIVALAAEFFKQIKLARNLKTKLIYFFDDSLETCIPFDSS